MAELSYVELHRSGELERRAARALELLGSPCRVCPRLCSVDRLADERGLCKIGRHAEQLGPDTYVNLMGQYYPAGKTDRYEEINRRPEHTELERAFEIADELGLRRLDARSRRQAVGVA